MRTLNPLRRSARRAIHLLSAITFTLAAGPSLTAAVLFSGDYSPDKWTLVNQNANGSVDVSGAPNSIQITGGDNGTGSPGRTDYTIALQSGGTVSFNWLFSSLDDTGFDDAGWLKNGAFTLLTATLNSGTASFIANPGDVIGFRVTTVDNRSGAAHFAVSSFDVTPVPEPAQAVALCSLLVPLLAIGWEARKRFRKA